MTLLPKGDTVLGAAGRPANRASRPEWMNGSQRLLRRPRPT